MKQALTYLQELLADGYDYADAIYKAAAKYKVSYQGLQDAYDTI